MQQFSRLAQRLLFPLLLTVLSLPIAAQAEVRVVVEGIDGALRENVINYVGEPSTDDPRMVRRFMAGVPDDARSGMEALGYYRAVIDVETRRDGDDREVIIRVDPGEPVRLRDIKINFGGEAATDAQFIELRQRAPFTEGNVLHHGRYESYKRSVESLALARGYFDGRFAQSQVRVHPAEGWADVTIDYEAGRRYRLGEVRFSETMLSDGLLQRHVPFSAGDPFTSDQITVLNRNLLSSDYFDSVRVRPQAQEADEDGRVPVDAEVELRPQNRIGTGAGFATDVGPRLRLNWARPWVNPEGHSMSAESELSPVRQSVSGTYSVPLDPPLEEKLQFLGGYQREEIEDTRSQRLTAGVQRQRIMRSGWTRNVFLRWEKERFKQGNESGQTTLTLPGASLSRSRSRGGVNVTWGDRQFASVEASDRELGSSIRLARIRLSTKWLRSYGRHRGIARAEYGALATQSLERTPPSLRFFTGGDQSVRGFAYQSLAPRDDDGNLIGGRYLAVASLEYDYEFIERWRAATFIDVGNAFRRAGFNEGFERGVGAGVRWQSPVGPIRLDLAFGISRPSTPWRLHFSMGPEI